MAAVLWHLGLVACYVILCVTSSPVDEAEKNDEEIDEKSEEKRSGYPCIVGGQVFQHGQVFSYPGMSTCIRYRCNNGGFSVVQAACDRRGQCIPEGSTIRDGCRSLRCTRESRNNMYYYLLVPTVQDSCNLNGRCVPVGSTTRDGCRSLRCTRETRHNINFYRLLPTVQDRCESNRGCVRKNVPFEDENCLRYRCVGTANGGYRFEFLGRQKCRTDSGRCVDVGSTYSKRVNGRLYRRCTCLPGGAHRCVG